MIILLKALNSSALNRKTGGTQPWVKPKVDKFKYYLSDKAYNKRPDVFVHHEVGGLQDLILSTYLGESSEYALHVWTSDVAMDIAKLKLQPQEPVIIVIAGPSELYRLMLSLGYEHDQTSNLGQIGQGGFTVRESPPSAERPGGNWHFAG